MKIGYKPICKEKIDSKGEKYSEFLFLVTINGCVVCAVGSEDLAISVVKLYKKINELYIKHVTFRRDMGLICIAKLAEKERIYIAKYLEEEEKALFDFLLEAERQEQERQEQEREEQERQEQERQEQEREEQEREEQEREEQEREEQERHNSRFHP